MKIKDKITGAIDAMRNLKRQKEKKRRSDRPYNYFAVPLCLDSQKKCYSVNNQYDNDVNA